MPQDSTATIQRTVERLMDSVRSFLPALELQETTLLLQHLHEEMLLEQQRLQSLNSSHTALCEEAAVATDYSRLREIHETLNSLEMDRFMAVQSVGALHANCTEYRDILTNRTMMLVQAEMEKDSPKPDIPYALVSMGSDGREEQTLITDQDHLIVYGDGGGEGADDWFRRFSELLVERLAEIGFKKCTGDIMPSNPTWRGSYSQWKRRITSIVRYEYEDYAKNLMNLIVLSDARHVAGDRELAEKLVLLIRSLEQDYFQVLWGMAKAATEMKLGLGFLKRLWTDGIGEHKGEMNIKLLAWAPLVMNVRILAINQGIPATSTCKRIQLLAQEKSFSETFAEQLLSAYEVLTRHRILLQVRVIKGIQKDSYYLNPYQLPPEEQEAIRQSLLRIEELQKVIHTNFSIM
jgi:signal-transduction protein with cAMP-binding, CBS, and nucleotidyltransferase domain